MEVPVTDVASVDARLAKLSQRLAAILSDFIQRGLPPRRVAKLAGLLLLSKTRGDHVWAESAVEYLLQSQRSDGGWVDTEDTAWAAFVIGALSGRDKIYRRCLNWVLLQRSGQAWGYCPRDDPSIPSTSLVHFLLPEVADQDSAVWLADAWEKDLWGPYRLSYKAAWFLLARARGTAVGQLEERTVVHLRTDQRQDGGWGPWRDHPAPTDCFATGIAMTALAETGSVAVAEVLHEAVGWALASQLPDGLFPTHFIEEGSGWMLLGLSCAQRLMARGGP